MALFQTFTVCIHVPEGKDTDKEIDEYGEAIDNMDLKDILQSVVEQKLRENSVTLDATVVVLDE